MSSHYVVLLLGSNIGDTEQNLKNAIAKIEKSIGNINFFSQMIESMPVEFVSNNIFRNIALGLFTQHSPFFLLKAVKRIEEEMGRLSDSFAIGEVVDRLIDIDIVTYDNINFESNKLILPHKKHLFERDFSKVLLQSLNEKIKTQI